MATLNDSDKVKEQYSTANTLSTRISIHSKYSVNKQGFGNWIFEQYSFLDAANILELGCGNGTLWADNMMQLPPNSHLTLTDFSQGMLEEAQKTLSQSDNIQYKQVDIQEIPYADKTFDAVIANMMLYHVPDLDKGLQEVTRVMRPNSLFYCATYGENGILEYVQDLLIEYGVKKDINTSFTLQNGESILRKHFGNVEKRVYKDALEVRDSNDLIDYVFSLTSISDLPNISKNELFDLLEAKKVDGKIHVPKEYGLFIARN